jgi:hypothetical protein
VDVQKRNHSCVGRQVELNVVCQADEHGGLIPQVLRLVDRPGHWPSVHGKSNY